MGNLHVLFSGPSHLYEFCISQRQRQNTTDWAPVWVRQSDALHPGPAATQSVRQLPFSSLLCVSQSTVVHNQV